MKQALSVNGMKQALSANGVKQSLSAFPAALLDWYRENARDLPWRHTRDPYRIWISEIMLQQTRVAAVIGYYRRFLDTFPTAEALAAADEETLLSLWQGLGYYSRARNLQKAARIIAERGAFPRTYAQLRALPGIGDYTAGAIASAAFALPVPAVDGNVLRVLSRVTDCREAVDAPAVKARFREALAEIFPDWRYPDGVEEARRGGAGKRWQEDDTRLFNQSVMELGATVCVPNGPPRCERCPVAAYCLARERGTAEKLPIRAAKKERRVEDRTVFVLLRDGKTALRKRPASGLLARLWEFPNVPGALDEARAVQTVQDWGLRVQGWHSRVSAKHIFTHVEWHMRGYALTVSGGGPEDFQWTAEPRLFAIPSAFARFREEAEKHGLNPCAEPPVSGARR